MTKNKSEKKSNKPGKKKNTSRGENKRMKKEAMISHHRRFKFFSQRTILTI